MSDAEFIANLQWKYDMLQSDIADLRRAVASAVAGVPFMYEIAESADIREIWGMLEPILMERIQKSIVIVNHQ